MSAAAKIRILMVEDHPVFREGFKLILDAQPDMQLVAQADNPDDAIMEFVRHTPDVTLLDEHLPKSSGTQLAVHMKSLQPRARLIMLTSSEGDGGIRRALRAGVAAYLLKSTQRKELLDVIRSVHLGQRFVPADVAEKLEAHRGSEELTARELEVLLLIRDGMPNRAIAERMTISESTVNFHIKNCVGKLNANDRAHAVIVALRRGLISL